MSARLTIAFNLINLTHVLGENSSESNVLLFTNAAMHSAMPLPCILVAKMMEWDATPH